MCHQQVRLNFSSVLRGHFLPPVVVVSVANKCRIPPLQSRKSHCTRKGALNCERVVVMKIQMDIAKRQRPFHSAALVPIAWLSIGVVLGFLLGGRGSSSHNTTNNQLRVDVDKDAPASNKITSFVSHVDELPLQATSHAGVNKKVLSSPFDLASNFAGFSMASIQPGQRIESHHHPTMFEFFFVLSGEGYVATTTIANDASDQQSSNSNNNNEVTSPLRKGSFLLTAPGDFHSFRVDNDKTEPLQMMYFG